MLDIDIISKYGILFVRLYGKLSRENCSKLNTEVVNFINDVGIYNVVINIQNLSYIDPYGIKVIKRCSKMCENSLICVNPIQLNKVEDMNIIYDENAAFNIINI